MKKGRRVKGIVHSRYIGSGNKVRRTKRLGRGARIAIVVSVAALFSVIFAISVGNLLNDKSRSAKQYFDTVEPMEIGGELTLGKAPSLTSCELAIGDKPSFENGEYSAVSFFVNNEEGLLYRSSVADHFGRESSSETELGAYVEELKSEGYYTVACFYSRFMMIEDPLISEAEALYEQGLIAEIAGCGVDEVMVVFAGENNQNFSLMREFMRSVKMNCDEIVLGMLLDISSAKNSEAWAEISKFSLACDYTALDLRNTELSEDGGEDAGFVASIRFYLSEYGVRILFDGENETMKSFVEKMKISNWMIVSRF